jgi:hypothetical protein
MSRIPKYRVWFKGKKMRQVTALHWVSGGLKWNDSEKEGWIHVEPQYKKELKADSILMTFTGAYDRLKQEVWEDDIIVWPETNRKRYYRVQWDEEEHCWVANRRDDSSWLFGSFEIVGNAHELPDLVK